MLAVVQGGDSDGQDCVALAARLRARSVEVEEVILTRVNAIGGMPEIDDSEYLLGFRAAVKAAIGYGLTAIESGAQHPPPVPAEVLTQARVAARYSVGLDTVIRRYVAGRDELSGLLTEEAAKSGVPHPASAVPVSILNAAFDRLLAELGAEYGREPRGPSDSPSGRLVTRVKQLLAGEHRDVSTLDYDLSSHHLGLVTEGPNAPAAVRDLTRALDGRLLLIQPDGDTVWAWIGLRRQISRGDLDKVLKAAWPETTPLAIGEIASGICGWRLTNNQARSVFPFALSGEKKVVRYVDNALLTSMARDQTLTASLREIYIAPLEAGRDGGEIERQTLCAYFASGRNGNTAAAALGVSRQTVSNRLRSAEEGIGLSLIACATDLELALRLADHGLI